MPKYLGQHFLKNKLAIKKIVDALGLESGDVVVEVGPGHGELTNCLIDKLLNYSFKIIAIEKDEKLANQLSQQFNNLAIEQFQLIEGDILKILPNLNWKLGTGNWKLTGNIPYYLTGYLFRIIEGLENKPSVIVFTIQKEVAERIIARQPYMNLLAASIQVWADSEIIDYISAKDFEPMPKVDSAIIRLKIKDSKFKNDELENYYKLIRIIFKQPRKMILNNLDEGLRNHKSRLLRYARNDGGVVSLNISKEEIIEELKKVGLSGKERPQNLDIEMLIRISGLFV